MKMGEGTRPSKIKSCKKNVTLYVSVQTIYTKSLIESPSLAGKLI